MGIQENSAAVAQLGRAVKFKIEVRRSFHFARAVFSSFDCLSLAEVCMMMAARVHASYNLTFGLLGLSAKCHPQQVDSPLFQTVGSSRAGFGVTKGQDVATAEVCFRIQVCVQQADMH